MWFRLVMIDSFLGELAWLQGSPVNLICWRKLKKQMEVALENGALGGKVTGAGGGGHMVFCCEFERRHLVADALIDLGLTVSELVFSRDGVTTWRGHG